MRHEIWHLILRFDLISIHGTFTGNQRKFYLFCSGQFYGLLANILSALGPIKGSAVDLVDMMSSFEF